MLLVIINVGKLCHALSLLGKDMSRLGQMTGKVGQVCHREDLDRIGAQIIIWVFQLLEDPVGGSDLVPMPRRHWL